MKPRSPRTPDRRAPKSPFERNRAQSDKPKHNDSQRADTRRSDTRQSAAFSQRPKRRPTAEDFEQTDSREDQQGQGRDRERQERRGYAAGQARQSRRPDQRGREDRGRDARGGGRDARGGARRDSRMSGQAGRVDRGNERRGYENRGRDDRGREEGGRGAGARGFRENQSERPQRRNSRPPKFGRDEAQRSDRRPAQFADYQAQGGEGRGRGAQGGEWKKPRKPQRAESRPWKFRDNQTQARNASAQTREDWGDTHGEQPPAPITREMIVREARGEQPPAPVREGLVVDRRAALRLRSGNPWAYRSDLVSASGVEPGAFAPVTDERGKPLGTAFYSSSSQIAVRMISAGPVQSESDLLDLVRQRLRSAIEYRERVVENSDACRLVFSEADFLPGLIVDRYNDVLTLQVLTQAMDRSDMREALTAALVAQLSPAAIVERVEPRIRELEQLPPRESGLLYGDRSTTTFTMNDLTFQFEALAGQKTGAFLDQRENYMAAAKYARGEALDVFCYQGGFALHLARVCDRVTGVDSSRPALETAEQNAVANQEQFGGLEIDWLEANAFDVMRDYADSGQQYDTIVVDPPAFAKSKKMLETAMRGYKELNLRALKMLRPGGVLVTCSCSFHVSETDFMQMLADAATDAHRSLRILEKRGAAKDHPALLSFPESQYLKCVIAVAQ